MTFNKMSTPGVVILSFPSASEPDDDDIEGEPPTKLRKVSVLVEWVYKTTYMSDAEAKSAVSEHFKTEYSNTTINFVKTTRSHWPFTNFTKT